MSKIVDLKCFMVWAKCPLIAENIQIILESGFEIHTKATSMSDGDHAWYLKNNKIRCFGSGQNWSDQDDFINLSNLQAYEKIAEISKYEAIQITPIW